MDARTLPAKTTESDPTPSEIGPRIWGVIDVFRKNRIGGWVIDRSDSAAVVEIDIRYEGRVIKTVKADRHRPDLLKGGVGTGNYGFVAELDPPTDPDFAFTLTATARTTDGETAVLKRVGAEAPPKDPQVRLMNRIFEELVAFRQHAETQDRRSVDAALGETTDRLQTMIERVELSQIRLEAVLGKVEPAPLADPSRALRFLVWLALAIALVSLGLGGYSLWHA